MPLMRWPISIPGSLGRPSIEHRASREIERIGDLAKNIAKRAIKIAGEMNISRATIGLRSMHESAAMLLKEVLDAYAQRDDERARAVWIHDADLDALED